MEVLITDSFKMEICRNCGKRRYTHWTETYILQDRSKLEIRFRCSTGLTYFEWDMRGDD